MNKKGVTRIMLSKKTYLGIAFLVLGVTGYTWNTYHSHQAKPETVASASTQVKTEQAVPAAEMGKTPHVDIVNEKGGKIGVAVLKQEEQGVRIMVQVSKLTPGKHGIHIHEAAFMDNNFDTAGSHFNPFYKHHGLKNPKGPHLGDMPNLVVKEDGTGVLDYVISKATLEPDKPNSLRGKSIIIHENVDDEKSDPAGNSGVRIAGGVIPK